MQADLEARLQGATGIALIDPYAIEGFGPQWLARRSRLAHTLADMTLAEFIERRCDQVQRNVAPLGVRIEKGSQYFDRFMRACFAAELRAADKTILRETKRDGFDHPHPDDIQGPWRKASPAAERIIVPPAMASVSLAAQPAAGHTLADCLAQWKANRTLAKKPINAHLTDDMENTFARFREHAGVDDIGQITRKHVIAFRDGGSGG
ncbi:hypothetical protein [Microvirga sp. CF3016]|uniref:hypothetical protein n=1 Tax=Microvirga sp. CF3016 TaxID=3110181 RepID=UPI002E77C455|nr:hypothetical protein [Microvirga sp. CF3016]MEE1609779.1 hypothetical protein [Microvirga sp. CF3016]